MIENSNISFFKLLTAGFISAETFRVIKAKKHLGNLNIAECGNYSPDVESELKRLFNDSSYRESICFIGLLEQDLLSANSISYNLLSNLFPSANGNVQDLINKIGFKPFISKYIFCTEECLRKLYFVNDHNFDDVIFFRQKYIDLLKSEFARKSRIADKSSEYSEQSTTIANDSNEVRYKAKNENWTGKDDITIDDDACDNASSENKIYIYFIYSLTKEQFEELDQQLVSLLNACPVRVMNGINAIGHRNFLVNYFFAKEIKLSKIRNFGRKSIFDLRPYRVPILNLVRQSYITHNNIVENSDVDSSGNESPSNVVVFAKEEPKTLRQIVGDDKFSILVEELKRLKSRLSNRASNALNACGDDDFLENFVYKGRNLYNIKNIGRKTISQINDIVVKLKKLVDHIISDSLTLMDLSWLTKRNLYGDLLDDFSHEYFLKHEHLPMMHILDRFFNQSNKDRSFVMLNEVIPMNGDLPCKDFQAVATSFDITRERVRQLFYKATAFLSNEESDISSDIFGLYQAILSDFSDWNYIKKELSTKKFWQIDDLTQFAKRESCQLSSPYIAHVFSMVFSGILSLVGATPLSVSKRGRQWNNTFLISNTLTDIFDFDKMSELTHEYIENSIGDNSFTPEELLLGLYADAWKNLDVSNLEDLIFVATNILIAEFQIIPELDGSVVFSGKKKRDTADLIYEILQQEGNPLLLSDLFNLVDSVDKGRYKSPNSLKTIISKDSRIYMISNTNKVALYEWEHVAMGSIRDLIVEFLSQCDTPQPVANIVQHVLSLRDTSENSIRSTMSTGSQFKSFAGGYYGLTDKTYSDWYSLGEAERNAALIRTDFEAFLSKNQHFPFSQSSSTIEKQLYQWWQKAKRNASDSDYFEKLVSSIEVKYASLPRTRSEFIWFDTLKEYKQFYRLYNRRPRGTTFLERKLQTWFDRTLDQLGEDRLTDRQEKAFYELCNNL